MPRHARLHILAGLIVSLALSLAVAAPASATPCKYRNLTPTTSNLAKVRSAVRCLVNRERTSRAIPELKPKGALRNAAQRHAVNMVRERFFSHVAPNGSTPRRRIRAAGYLGNYLGENIAWGPGHATPRQMVIDWMNSRGHRRNILNPSFRYGGVGVVPGGPRDRLGATYVTTFGGGR